ncbi:helix-turn-helix transcriptional regulator [Streptacidiphilus jiangxiensis]|uniref:Regulatory protein, luxR family n=1 Tax=Streptacidiphilus jiangxiensis TaxID=235985 RepID=A0A1H7JKM9_STRJI|nr:LuxR C-terminal-related transcriptional regulator [Streptacidiphilus jiangxiensis]SEK74417.1 regulatory protein, luxR family [Streptacidiphilus jiangxiensis]
MANPQEPPGLDARTASVYRAMLAHPGARPAELARLLSLTEDHVRSAVVELDRLALVRRSDEAPGRHRPLRPDVAMDVLMARQETLLREYAQQLALSREAAAQLVAEAAGPGTRAGRAGVEVLVGIDEIRDRLAALSRDVTEELLSFAPDGPQTDENMRASRPLNTALLGRGVRLRTLYLTSIRSHPPTLAHAQWLADSGGQVRTVATLPTRMLVIDRRTAVLPTDSQDTKQGAVVVSVAGVVAALCALFEAVWAQGEALTLAPPGAQPRTARGKERDLSTQELATLRLMATGLTLGGIAKRLGVSPRTARRITAALLERLDAGSRFEAGVKAVQRGWLPADG